LDRLERVRDDRAHLLAEPYPAHTKEPIDYEAVFAIMDDLFETAPMGRRRRSPWCSARSRTACARPALPRGPNHKADRLPAMSMSMSMSMILEDDDA
jgi:hypothetical protein